MILYLDLETFSETPIQHGTSRYAVGSEVLLSAFACDDDPVDVVEGWSPALTSLADSAERVVIHNARFDRTILLHQDIEIDLRKIHCTQAQARSVGLPGSLDKLCDILAVPTDKAKEKQGRALIQLFCKPRPKNHKERRATKLTHPEEWRRFMDYAGLDVEAMRECYKRLPIWNYQGFERGLWELDQRINQRGFAIDLDLARTAIDTVNDAQKLFGERTQELTDGEVESTNQRDALLKHLLDECGVTLPDLQKSTLERRLTDENLPEAARELIAIRLEASSTSVAKYRALVNATSPDGRLRGALEFCGASRTGRWSGRLFQPQNLPRTPDWFSPDEQAETIAAVKNRTADLVYEDVIKRCSYSLRGSIVAPEGKKLLVADLANIEGRVLAWLAGEQWKLDAFRAYDEGTGPDLYKLAYARSFNVRPDDVGKDQRQLGKVQELALGYQGGVGAFVSMVAVYNLDLPGLTEAVMAIATPAAIEKAKLQLETMKRRGYHIPVAERTWLACKIVVNAWRTAHKAVENFWYVVEGSAHDAVRAPGVTLSCGRLKFRRDGNWLRMILPSGRALCYPAPWIDTENRSQLTYKGVNQYTRKWERISTYGGKLAENATQAVARDVLADAMVRAEEASHQIVMHVHDELVSEMPDQPEYTAAGLVGIMTTNPAWADGLPLAAEGEEMRRYRK